jgi:hypothetical protein
MSSQHIVSESDSGEMEHHVKNFMRLMIFNEQRKIPLKKEDARAKSKQS